MDPTATARAVVTAYEGGMTVQDICDTFGVSRTQVADIIQQSGVRRGLGGVTRRNLADLYALLYAAQLEIEALRREVENLRRN